MILDFLYLLRKLFKWVVTMFWLVQEQ